MNASTKRGDVISRFAALVNFMVGVCRLLPMPLMALLARFAIARVFFVSGQTKVEGPEVFGIIIPTSLKQSTFYLFEYEYALPIIPPKLAAYAGTTVELLLPVLLVLGLGTRFAALALAIMTLIIQYVYPDAWWTVHMWWLLILLIIVSYGPGAVSLDHIIRKAYPDGGAGS